MKKLLILSLMISYVQITLSQELEVLGNVQANTIKILNGAGDGKILVSDADGDASWSDPFSRKRSIMITPSMANVRNGAVHSSVGVWNLPSIDFPEAGNPEANIGFSIPADYKANGFSIKLLYTSSTTSGNFRVELGVIGVSVGSSLDQNPGGAITLTSPTNINDLVKGERFQADNTGLFNPDYEFINLVVRRNSADALDTSIGILKIVGIVVTYDD